MGFLACSSQATVARAVLCARWLVWTRRKLEVIVTERGNEKRSRSSVTLPNPELNMVKQNRLWHFAAALCFGLSGTKAAEQNDWPTSSALRSASFTLGSGLPSVSRRPPQSMCVCLLVVVTWQSLSMCGSLLGSHVSVVAMKMFIHDCNVQRVTDVTEVQLWPTYLQAARYHHHQH